MIYKIHRVASNPNGWTRPSAGRLGLAGFGDYVKKNGFGHEDWNFNFDFAVDGVMQGFTVARPGAQSLGEEVGLVMATYDAGEWRAVGYCDGAKFVDESNPPSPNAVRQMASDVCELSLAGEVSGKIQNMNLIKIEKKIRKDFKNQWWWTAPLERIVVLHEQPSIPKEIFNPGVQRMKISYNLTEAKFKAITKLGVGVKGDARERSSHEGEPSLRLHKIRERDPTLVAAFKNSLKSFACTVCHFDFGKTYGKLGAGFIECHHIKPVSKMKSGEKTQLSDLSAVCANCHRMLHRTGQELSLAELGDLIGENESPRS
jgi:hypothetical protein